MKARLRFHGAAGEVTGSLHLIEANGYRIALDCGLYQGHRAEGNQKNRSFPCPPAEIDAVLLSHAHIDHCGKLPRLVRDGFTGPIYATPPSCDLTEILLADSAHIQEEDAIYLSKKRAKHGEPPIEPLYRLADVEQTLKLLKPRPLKAPFEVLPGVSASFHEAGHMLGSASINVTVASNGKPPLRITFSGDQGRAGLAILKDPAPLPACDYLICESTYGGRANPPAHEMRSELANIVNATIRDGGKIIIPAFAVGRTQTVVYQLHRLIVKGLIPAKVPIIVDGPLASRATEIYRRHPETYDREAAAFNHDTQGSGGMLDCQNCRYIENVEESKALNHQPGPMIIISASGMCEVGRILHHLKNNIENPRNTVLIVGYQAEHTLGRRIANRDKKVKIFGEMYSLNARVKVFHGFSSHADAGELTRLAAPLAKQAKAAFLVHGEREQLSVLAESFEKRGFPQVHIPSPGQVFDLE